MATAARSQSLPTITDTTTPAQAVVVYGFVGRSAEIKHEIEQKKQGAMEMDTRKVIPPGGVGLEMTSYFFFFKEILGIQSDSRRPPLAL